jgi:hypothetical protein
VVGSLDYYSGGWEAQKLRKYRLLSVKLGPLFNTTSHT